MCVVYCTLLFSLSFCLDFCPMSPNLFLYPTMCTEAVLTPVPTHTSHPLTSWWIGLEGFPNQPMSATTWLTALNPQPGTHVAAHTAPTQPHTSSFLPRSDTAWHTHSPPHRLDFADTRSLPHRLDLLRSATHAAFPTDSILLLQTQSPHSW